MTVNNNDSTNSRNEKRFTLAYDSGTWWAVRDDGITLWKEEVITELNKLHEENITIKKDEKQLSIDFIGFKMKLIEVLQKNYDYAYNQRQKNLDDVKIAHAYAMLMGTVKGIAEDMEVDLDV